MYVILVLGGDAVPTKRERAITARVIDAREQAGLDRRDLAKALSLDLNSYGHYERGRYAFTVEQLLILSRVLSKPIEYLLGLVTGLSEDEAQVLHIWRQIELPEMRDIAMQHLRTVLISDRRLRGQD